MVRSAVFSVTLQPENHANPQTAIRGNRRSGGILKPANQQAHTGCQPSFRVQSRDYATAIELAQNARGETVAQP